MNYKTQISKGLNVSDSLLMSIDVGGSNIRCLLLNTRTGQTHCVAEQVATSRALAGMTHSHNLDTDLVWRTTGRLSRRALEAAGARPESVVGIASTSMRHGTVIVDRDGRVLFAAPNIDARGSSHSTELASESGSAFHEKTGHWPCPIMMPPRLMWLAENQPAILENAHAIFSVSDWLGYQLSGKLYSERSQAAESMLLDLDSGQWATDLIRRCDLKERWFPPLVDAGTPVGNLGDEAAAHLGLPPGIPVAAGGGDTQCALLALGVVEPGQLGIVSGSTAPVQQVVAGHVVDKSVRVWTGLHVIPGLHVMESNAGGIGYALEWFAKALHPERDNRIDVLIAEAASVAPGINTAFSTIGAELFNAREMRLPVDTLTFSTLSPLANGANRKILSRAVVEGMAYAIRANVEQLQEITGLTADAITVGGGMARSGAFGKIVQDVIGRDCFLPRNPESSAIGAAICAGVAAGIYPDLPAGARALPRNEQAGPSDTTNTDRYSVRYKDWQRLFEQRDDTDMLAAEYLTEALLTPESTETAPLQTVNFTPAIYVSADMDENSLARLRAFGDVTYASYRDAHELLVGDDLVERLSGYNVFVTEVDVVDLDVLKRLPELRAVICCRGNPVNIDLPACTAAGVPVIGTPGRNAVAVAEATLSYMLMSSRKMEGATGFLRQPGGEEGDMGRMGMAHYQLQGHELWHKTLGIVGGGAVGREVVARALPFGMRVLICDPHLTEDAITLLGGEKCDLEELLGASDFISLHLPLTDETKHIIAEESFSQMKKDCFLINTARAGLVERGALIAALESGTLGGAALDVFDVEPPASDDPLLSFSNVIATPHIAGNTFEVAEHQGALVAQALESLLKGRTPEHALNPGTLQTFSWTQERQFSKDDLDSLDGAGRAGVTDLDVTAQGKSARKTAALPKETAPPPQRGLLSRLFHKESSRTTSSHHVQSAGGELTAIRSKMTAILELFTSYVAAEPAMQAFSEGRDVIFQLTVRDLDLHFFMAFCNGSVSSSLGVPPRDPDVNLKMTGHTLDGMFTGAINPTRAAMTGKLSFSGDTVKAMAFQRALKDIQSLYSRAREEIGDPGDLGALNVATGNTTDEDKRAADRQVQSVETPRTDSTDDIRSGILQATNELFAKGYLTATGGNISARVDDRPDEIWITPSQVFKGDLSPDSMVRIDLSGKPIGDNRYTASSERKVHCSIYRTRSDINAVVHSHTKYATLLALTNTPFLPISTEAAFIGKIPVVPFIMPGSDELGDAVAEALGGGCAVIMQNHGLVVAASDLRRAADVTDIIELTAEKIIRCKMLGIDPPLLDDDVLSMLKEIGEMMV